MSTWAVLFAMWLPFFVVGGLAFWAFHRFSAAKQHPPTSDTAALEGEQSTSMGMRPNHAATLAYALGFVSGLVLLLIEKRSRYVRYHAVQSTLTFGGLLVCQIVVSAIPLWGFLVAGALTPFSFLLWAFLMVKAYGGEWYRVPMAGGIALAKSRDFGT
jgi:uncharacterized membrane protein